MIYYGQLNTSSLNGSTFIGLNKSLLRYVSCCNCSIGDAEVLCIARDCPDILEMCLNSCNGVTDASVKMLLKRYLQLVSIDIGDCVQITGEGLVAFGCSIEQHQYFSLQKYRVLN